MNSHRVSRDCIRFEFLPIHARVETSQARDRLFLDCGNSLAPGVIDHHHLPAYTGSTAGLIVRHPELIRESIRAERCESDPFFITLHDQPDLDCVVSASLAASLLSDGELPECANALASYVDRVDAGHPGFSQEQPYSLYAAYLLLVHDLAGKKQPDWTGCLLKGMEIIEHVLRRVSTEALSVWEIDAFECDKVFRPRDRKEIELDLARYFSTLTDPSKFCRQVRLRLPGEFGGHREVDALFARNVQNIDDPERCVYFKDWARTDKRNSRERKGFVALSVFIPESDTSDSLAKQPPDDVTRFQQVRRCILSVAPAEGVTLRGLGKLLDQAESRKRIEKYGRDNRVIDVTTGKTLPPRVGYENSDPWYDGRGHNYTIVDSPRTGTVLSADEIEAIFLEFGTISSKPELKNERALGLNDNSLRKCSSREESITESDNENRATGDLPSSERVSFDKCSSGSPENLSQMSAMVENWKAHQTVTRKNSPIPDIFISYPHLRLEWVESQVAQPLAKSLGKNRVFFDKDHLQAGMSWLTTLADSVMNCRLFIPIYCQPYFQSDFCQWELQLALTRDPTGRKRIITPIQIEPLELPPYCRLIQAQMSIGNDFTDQLLKLVNEILD